MAAELHRKLKQPLLNNHPLISIFPIEKIPNVKKKRKLCNKKVEIINKLIV